MEEPSLALNLKDMQKICVPENIILTMHAAKRIEHILSLGQTETIFGLSLLIILLPKNG